MKTHSFLTVNSANASAGSNRGPRWYTGRHMVAATPSNETLPGFERQASDNVTVIDCEKRKVRDYEYRSRIHMTELRIPSAAFFPDLDVDEGVDNSTAWSTESTSLNRRPNKRQALSLDISTDTTHSIDTDTGDNDYDDEERDSDSNDEIIDILTSVPRLKLKRRTMISNPKDTQPHIIPDESKK